MNVTAVVVTYESQALVVACIEAILGSGVQRVVVWDNSPGPATRDALAEIGDARVEIFGDGSNLGFGGGVNAALRWCAPEEMVLLVNPDCIVNAAAIRAMALHLEQVGAGAVAPRMRYPDGREGTAGGAAPSMRKEFLAYSRLDDLLPRRVREAALRRWGTGYPIGQDQRGGVEVDWVCGFCMLVSVADLMAVGGFDPRFFLYFEDVDLCQRLRSEGMPCAVLTDVEVLHLESTSTTSRGKSRHYRTGLATYMESHGSQRQIRSARILSRLP